MPYEIRKVKEEFCVFNQDTGENKGCSKSEKKAIAHLRLLYFVEHGGKPTGTKTGQKK